MTFVNVNSRRRRQTSINPLFNLVNDIFTTSVSELEKNVVRTRPAVNVIEGKDNFRLEIAAPGLGKSDFDINVEKDQLTISAKKEIPNDVNIDKFSRKEFSYTSFSRSFYLPKGVKKDEISAVYEDGILILVLPKKEEAKEIPARAIEVR